MAKAQAGTATIAAKGARWVVIGADGKQIGGEFESRQECKAYFIEHVAGEGSAAKAAAAEELAPLSPGE